MCSLILEKKILCVLFLEVQTLLNKRSAKNKYENEEWRNR